MTLHDILKEIFHIKEEEFKDEQSILALDEFDSMNHMLLVTKIEEVYNVELSGDEIISIHTIGDIKQILSKKGV
ncbi:MAG: acyl carrier protein, partial [Bacteroidota bacterium]